MTKPLHGKKMSVIGDTVLTAALPLTLPGGPAANGRWPVLSKKMK